MSVAFLAGYRALDLTTVSGQLCGRVLADLGMEVIKIERRAATRCASCRRSHDRLMENSSAQLLRTSMRAKRARSWTSIVKRIALSSDGWLKLRMWCWRVFSRASWTRKGSGIRVLRRSIPDCHGFDHRFRPDRAKENLACNDLVALAESGFLYISGDPSLPPCRPPETQAYYFASLFAAAGLLAALYRREHGTGRSRGLVDAGDLGDAGTYHPLWANEKQISQRAGSQHGSVAPAKIFLAATASSIFT